VKPWVWLISRRDLPEFSELAALKTVHTKRFGGLLDLLKSSGTPTIIAVDHAEHDLHISDAALKIARQFPQSLLLALRQDALPEGSVLSEGIDESACPSVEWVPTVDRLAAELGALERLGWVGKSDALRHLALQVEQAAPSDISVLITGESGAGKELVARGLHDASPRFRKPFVPVNTGAIPETLLESELFGHEKGAFTGAASAHSGIFESAEGGTVFLDEIGDMPQATQVKLLRVLETRRFRRLGATSERGSDVRVVSATHQDLAQLEQDGLFRRDLYYRLSAVTLRVEPLRERPADVLPLLLHFWSGMSGNTRPPQELTLDAIRRLRQYAWPGNVRELRNFAEASAMAAASSTLTEEHVLQYVQRQRSNDRHLPVVSGMRREAGEQEMLFGAIWHLSQQITDLRKFLEVRLPAGDMEPVAFRPPADTIADAERRAIEGALLETAGNRREAARKLRIGERTLYRKIKEYGLK
jgi:DNA-binding NtrC family response regulator